MDSKTLAALEGSIQKWVDIAAGRIADEGENNCPLCKLFNNADSKRACFGCPVEEKTGKPYCKKTPYRDWCNNEPVDCMAKTPGQKKKARAEVKFLRSLLPKSHL